MKEFKPTPWLFSGDLRTLLPFLLFKPPDANYIRRWVRVPLAAGPRDKLSNDDGISSYEAVALDYAAPIVTVESKSQTYLLIIAGLTGGSREGYVQDLVHAASTMGYGCFVMLGRGLGHENKCNSMAGFHGARTSDVEVCARLLKKSILNKGDKLIIVGISMGGILCANAIGRGLLKKEDVDGAIAISPCFDTVKNINFWWSRRLWQPLLAQGLKDAFASKKTDLKKLQIKLGPGKNVKEVLANIIDVFDFDSMLVPPMHSFRDVYHYYQDMNCNESALLSSQILEKAKNSKVVTKDISLPVPLLVIHACDDPIIHADTLPCHSGIAETVDNLVVLVTGSGGHVGWALTQRPSDCRWLYQNNLILEFIAALGNEKD
jgi:predicted alpha/beta-fold hydrolase